MPKDYQKTRRRDLTFEDIQGTKEDLQINYINVS
jgi:hypothetical protein